MADLLMIALLILVRRRIRDLRLLPAHPEFAKTEVLSDRGLGRAQTRQPCDCGCGKDHLVRIARPTWMRVLPLFRLYSCRLCGRRAMRPRMRTRLGYGVVYLPARPLKCDAANMWDAVARVMRRIGPAYPPAN